MKILKFMSEMTERVDMAEFAEKTGIDSSQIVALMQELAKIGFLRKVGRGFAITEKGKNALKAAVPFAWDKRFNFYVAFDQPAGVSAGKISEFYNLICKVDLASLEFHMSRGDFENWFQTTVTDPAFADELTKIKESNLQGEELRAAIANALKLRYSL
jgi:predicted transcriptional regulator